MNTPTAEYRWLGRTAKRAPASKQLSSTEPVARNGNLSRAVRGFPRDRPIGYTIAPTPARQIWELHRIREESRQQSLVSPHYRAFLEWAQCFVIGESPFGLEFQLPSEAADRLRDATLWVRDQWRRYQDEEIGARGETLSELSGETLDWMLVDGDCFVIPYQEGGAWRYQGYPGDSLAETGHTPGTIGRGNEPQRALGIEVNSRGRPLVFHFGQRARFRSLGYTSYSTDVDAMPVPADRVWHIRDRRMHAGCIRGWPRITASFEYIARLNEFDQAFIRAAIRRASASIALKRDAGMTAGDFDRDDEAPDRDLADIRIEGTGEYTDESIKPYQEATADAGGLLVLEPGYEATDIGTGSPSTQEAMVVEKFEHRICKGLGVSLMTLTGDLKGVSFSSGQIGRIGDAATCYRLQNIMRRQVIAPVYRHWLMEMWPTLMMKFARVMPEDWMLFLSARHSMARYPVLEKGKLLAGVGKAFEDGIYDYAEARAEAGMPTDDIEGVIERWKAQREAMGLDAEPGPEANGAPPPKDKDDPDEEDDDDDDDSD